MKHAFLAALIASLCTLAPSHASGKQASSLAWRGWDAGLSEAGTSGRPVLVDVYTDWCGWCKRMDREVYSRQDVREYLSQRFVTIKLNAESRDPGGYEGKSYTSSSLAARFRVSGYPTTVFLRSDGGHVVNVPGYVPADRFLLLLRYIGDGHLDRGVRFDEFAKKNSARGK